MQAKLPAILALVTTLIGLVASPAVLGLIDPKWAAVIVAVGSAWQAFTKAIHHD